MTKLRGGFSLLFEMQAFVANATGLHELLFAPGKLNVVPGKLNVVPGKLNVVPGKLNIVPGK
jgi:hypothetical protein